MFSNLRKHLSLKLYYINVFKLKSSVTEFILYECFKIKEIERNTPEFLKQCPFYYLSTVIVHIIYIHCQKILLKSCHMKRDSVTSLVHNNSFHEIVTRTGCVFLC